MQKVLIIKIGYSETLDPEISTTVSLGDVLRSTVILNQFRNDHVTWLVDEKAFPLLEHNPYIKRLLIYDLKSVLQLQRERFDIVINLEKVPDLCALADSIQTQKRYGFGFDGVEGRALAYDGAETVLSLCDNLEHKRANLIHWQEYLVRMVGGEWQEQGYVFNQLPEGEQKFDVGFNWSVGSKWPNKAWPKENWLKLEKLLKDKFTISWQMGLNNLKEYFDWIHSCKMIVTSDSLGLHLAIAMKKKIVALYGPTSSREMFLYGQGVKIKPDAVFPCVPCLNPVCGKKEKCMNAISAEKVAMAVEYVMDATCPMKEYFEAAALEGTKKQ